jgi:hypothetical protein
MCWLFSEGLHWIRERKLNREARLFLKSTKRIFTHPKDCDEAERYVAKWYHELQMAQRSLDD